MDRGVNSREPCAEALEELEQLERAIYSATKAYNVRFYNFCFSRTFPFSDLADWINKSDNILSQ